MRKLLVLILLISGGAFSQVGLKTPLEDYYATMSLLGIAQEPSLSYRTLSNNSWHITDSTNQPWHLWEDAIQEPLWQRNTLSLSLVSPTFFNSYNLKTPSGMNDGGLWQGRGYNGALSAGITFKSKYFEATFAPELYFSENKAFTIAQSDTAWNGSAYGYYAKGIDFPQRMGHKEFWDYNWGQTEIRFNYNAFTLGVGTQNVWLGPGQKQAIIWSNNASGFPKIDIGINKKETTIGAFETRFWWGALKSSAYYSGGNTGEGTPDSYLDFVAGFTFSYAPAFIKGFTLGIHKTAQTPLDNFSFYSLVAGVDPSLSGKEKFGDTAEYYDHRLSLTWDWQFEQVGFNFYGEWSREDATWDIVQEAEHTRGLTIGVRQAFDLTKNQRHILEAEIEAASLVWSRDYFIKPGGWYGGYYRHHKTNLGYTHQGQGVGAGMGTGSNYQHYGINYFASFGMVGVYLNRMGHDDSPLYNSGQDSLTVQERPVMLEIGVKSTMLLPHQFSISGSIAYIKEINWKFDQNDDIHGVKIILEATYNR